MQINPRKTRKIVRKHIFSFVFFLLSLHICHAKKLRKKFKMNFGSRKCFLKLKDFAKVQLSKMIKSLLEVSERQINSSLKFLFNHFCMSYFRRTRNKSWFNWKMESKNASDQLDEFECKNQWNHYLLTPLINEFWMQNQTKNEIFYLTSQ